MYDEIIRHEDLELLEAARRFASECLRGSQCEYETIHPWRRDWKSVMHHSARVESYAVKIMQQEEHHFTDKECLLIRLAAVLHDLGRIERIEGHAEAGAAMAREWLRDGGSLYAALADIDVERLIGIIAGHSDKEKPEVDICGAVLKDADILDEIGALSIFMAANWEDRGDAFFFNHLLRRIRSRELDFCDRQLGRLNTAAARSILLSKKHFIEQFAAQLEQEIQGTEELLKIL